MTEPRAALLTFDTHIDIPWPENDEDAWQRRAERQFTVPKAAEGGLRAVCLAAYIPQTACDETGYTASWARAQAMLKAIHAIEGERDGQSARICRTVQAVRQVAAQGALAIVPVVENGHAIGEDVSRIGLLARDYGVRYLTLTHNGHNALADSAIARSEPPVRHGGLSALGNEAIREMNRHGMLVDVSHTAKSAMMQAVRASATPVVASHSCIRSLCDHPRNLDDEQLDLLKESGGVVQITAMGSFLRKGGGGTLDDLIRHVLYAVRRIGIEHVGLSSDFDGGGGIDGWSDVTQTGQVGRALRAAGFETAEIEALWGGNMLRLMAAAEQAQRGTR